MAELKLRQLKISDEGTFLAAIDEFRDVDPDWTFAFYFDEGTNFPEYVKLLHSWSEGKSLPEDFVPNTFLVAVVGDTIVGRVSIRHVLNDFLHRVGGHVGYGVVPSYRRKGYATEILRQTLPWARELGIERLLVTCDDDNVGSWRTIEANGGVLENIVIDPSTPTPKRRYWIHLGNQKQAIEVRIQPLNQVDEAHARKMFGWETDPSNRFYCGPCKGPDEKPRYTSWRELQLKMNTSASHRFGIYDGMEFVGEFSFVFNHPELMRNEPRTAWFGIGIGDERYRRKGVGTAAMATLESEVIKLGGKRIELGVLGFNEPAIRFYERLGYKRFAEIPNFTWWGDQWWSDFRYEKYLP